MKKYEGFTTLLKHKNDYIGKIYRLKGILRNVEVKITSQGNYFTSAILSDPTGMIKLTMWNTNLNDTDFKENQAIEGDFLINLYNEEVQLSCQNVLSFTLLNDEEKKTLIKKNPITFKKMKDDVRTILDAIEDEHYKQLCKEIFNEYHKELRYYPATEIAHHAYYGGLFYHIYSMLMQAINMKEKSKEYDLDYDLLITGILIHDIGKFKSFEVDRETGIAKINRKGELLGHTIIGVEELSRFILEHNIPMNEEKLDNLKHIILSHHYNKESRIPLFAPKFLEAELVHQFNELDSRLGIHYEIRKNLEKDEIQKAYLLENRSIINVY